LKKNRQPLDQTDFMYGGDASSETVEEYSRRAWKNPTGGPGSMVVGLAGPTWQLLVLHFSPVSSGIFWSLLVHISL
jgi:hypothetical protein